MTDKAVSIDLQANTCTAELVAENHLKLRSIAATVIFCGHQAIALRGHRVMTGLILTVKRIFTTAVIFMLYCNF